MVRVEELFQSCRIIKQAMQKIRAIGKNAPYRLKVPTNVPACTAMSRLEDPRGESLMYLVADGSGKPYRLKVRSPIFTNVSASKPLVVGSRIADVPAIMAMIDMCLGETDR
jgi:NADH-quinone oxidoreductase subunit D